MSAPTNGNTAIVEANHDSIRLDYDVPHAMRIGMMIRLFGDAVKALRSEEHMGKATTVLGQEPRDILLFVAEEFQFLHMKLNAGRPADLPVHLLHAYGVTQLIREFLAAEQLNSNPANKQGSTLLYGMAPITLLEYALPVMRAIQEWAKNTGLD